MNRYLLMAGLCAAVTVAACGQVNPITAARLAMVSPMEADPADFAVRMTLPEGLGVMKGSARLRIDAVGPGDQTRSGVFVLNQTTGRDTVFTVDPADLTRLRALQAQVRAWKAVAPDDTAGSLSINITPCTRGAGPRDDARVDVAIRLRADGDMLPLVSKGRIADVASTDDIADLPRCVS